MCTMTSVTSPSCLAAAGRTTQAEEGLSNPVTMQVVEHQGGFPKPKEPNIRSLSVTCPHVLEPVGKLKQSLVRD